jgi:hypothetical protein
VDTVVILREAAEEDDEAFCGAVRSLTLLTEAKIIVILRESAAETFIAAMVAAGITNIVTETEDVRFREELLSALADGGMTKYTELPDDGSATSEDVPVAETADKRFRGCKGLVTAFVGSSHRMGTTTAAMNFAYYVRSCGGRVCYIENNASGHLDMIARAYAGEDGETPPVPIRKYAVDGVDLFATSDFRAAATDDYNIAVVDCGSVTDGLAQGLTHADNVYLVSGVLPQELPYLGRAVAALADRPYIPLLMAVPDELAGGLLRRFRNAIFLTPSRRLFDGEANGEAFEEILREILKQEENPYGKSHL